MLRIVLAAFVLIFAAQVRASSDPRAWAAGTLGLSVPNQSNTTSRMLTGFGVGAKLGTEYGVGAYFKSSKKDESVNGVAVPWNYDLYGVTGAYFFEGEAKGVYLGGMIGTSKIGTTSGQQSLSTSPMHWGLMGGYDHFLFERFSLGGEVGYIAVSGSSATLAGATVTTDAFSMLNFLIQAKVWF